MYFMDMFSDLGKIYYANFIRYSFIYIIWVNIKIFYTFYKDLHTLDPNVTSSIYQITVNFLCHLN